MTKYLVSWTEEDYLNILIEADSADEAREKFYNSEFDDQKILHVGTELQDSVEVEEVTSSNMATVKILFPYESLDN